MLQEGIFATSWSADAQLNFPPVVKEKMPKNNV
jgi:hypothetical protein